MTLLASPYARAVLASKPFFYSRMDDGGGKKMVDLSGYHNDGSHVAGPLVKPGGINADPDGGRRYVAASSQASSVALNLSGGKIVTFECLFNSAAWLTNDALMAEYTANYNSNNGFIIDPNASAGLGFDCSIHDVNGYNKTTLTTIPSTGVWHHLTVVMDQTKAAANMVTPYIDGVAAGYTKSTSAACNTNWDNSTLYLASRATTSLFANIQLDEVAVYTRALTAAEIWAHQQARVGGPIVLRRLNQVVTNVSGDASLTITATLASSGNVGTIGNASLTVTDSTTSTGTVGANGNASLTVTASPQSTGIVGLFGNSSLLVTVAQANTETLGVNTGASLTVTAGMPSTGVVGVSSGASLLVTVGLTAGPAVAAVAVLAAIAYIRDGLYSAIGRDGSTTATGSDGKTNTNVRG